MSLLEILNLISSNQVAAAWIIFIFCGWLILAWLLIKAILFLWAYYKAVRYTSSWNWVVLAVDVPKENVQTPKAVEQLFAHVFSVMEPPSIQTVYRRGFNQFSFSFEIISIEGYIQFLIRTLDVYRDVVEAAIYAQYPEAEVTEVEDYTKDIPKKYPNDEYNCWAADFALTEHYAYPIRLYSEFEHSISKDTVLKDPMGTFLESFSRIGAGEQMWYQMIIEPLEEKKWKNEVMKKIKDAIGEKPAPSGGNLHKIVDPFMKAVERVGTDVLLNEPGDGGNDKGNDKGDKNDLLYMTSGQKLIVEGMEKKISKIGFKTKLRAIYLAKKEVYNPARGVNSLVGAINNFNIPSSNSILPKYLTSTKYLFADQRKNHRRTVLMSAYKDRNMYAGKDPYIFNLEELATLWHFPMSHVKTPLVQKSTAKRSEPPADLPIESILGGTVSVSAQQEEEKKESPERYDTDSGKGGFHPGQQFG